MTITLTKQEISDITISCETMMEQLNDEAFGGNMVEDQGDGMFELKAKYYRIWDLRNKLNK
tara:strand:- start:198 stop:380 length:183 start_codon:yes stop_codon:yes gene_type:complete